MILLHRKVLRRRRKAMTILAIVLFTLLVITVLGLMLSELNNIADFVQQHQKHRLCVTIPYRDRWKELQEMLPLLHKFLSSQGIKAMYIIVNQSDIFRFNRASLVNIGALEAERVGCDYMAIHDVDIVPLNVNLSYHYPEGHIMHTAAGKYHPIKRYDYKNFIGSVLIITLADFKKVNGMSNDFWGWGLEDDDFYLRLKEAGMADRIRRPSNLGSNRTNTFLHLHERGRRRDYSLDEYRKKRRRKRDKSSGLLNLNYTLKACRTLNIRDIGVSMLDVNLFCDPTFASHCYAVP